MLKSFTGVSQIGDIERLFVSFFSLLFPQVEFHFCDSTGPLRCEQGKLAKQQKYKTMTMCCSQITELAPKSEATESQSMKKHSVRNARWCGVLTGSHSTMTWDGDGGHSEGGRSDEIRNTLALISYLLPGGDRRAPHTARDTPGRQEWRSRGAV